MRKPRAPFPCDCGAEDCPRCFPNNRERNVEKDDFDDDTPPRDDPRDDFRTVVRLGNGETL